MCTCVCVDVIIFHHEKRFLYVCAKNEVMANVCIGGKTPFEHDFSKKKKKP